ncbi:MAG TPA: acyl-CoA dehydrogenase family protein, partial [Solirubrobacteraceae bacterium]
TTLVTDELVAFRESVRMFFARGSEDPLRAAAEHGFVAMGVPEEHGGLGIDDVRFAAVVMEEAMRAQLPALALLLTAHGDVPVRALLADGGHGDWLAGLATGELRAATALHARDGYAPAVVGAAHADLLIVGTAAIAATAATIEPIDAPVGLAGAGLANVSFDPAGVTALDADLGDLLIGERLLLALGAVAAAEAALDLTAEYVRDRRAFGTPIASFQNTRQLLGDATAKLRAAGALAQRALHDRVEGRLSAGDAAAAKLVATEAHAAVVDAGVQLHGGYGYMLEYPIAHAYADARFLRLHGTTSQDLRDELGASVVE